jgi:hypothetical protein
LSPFKDKKKYNEYMRGWRKRRAERVKHALALLEEQEKQNLENVKD